MTTKESGTDWVVVVLEEITFWDGTTELSDGKRASGALTLSELVASIDIEGSESED